MGRWITKLVVVAGLVVVSGCAGKDEATPPPKPKPSPVGTMPNVAGLRYVAASQEIKSAVPGREFFVIANYSRSRLPPGTVLKQRPRAGSELAANPSISLKLSGGPTGTTQVQEPSK